VLTSLKTFFAGHPVRIGAAAVAGVVALAAAWYLGSPLFLTTYTQEAPPTVATSAPATATAGATGAAPAQPQILAKGQLGYVDDLHRGTGEVQLLASGTQAFVRFQDVAIQNGPDLHVYLSKDTGGRYVETNSVYLGALKATNGSFNYDVPAGTDVSAHKSVIVWCRAFAVLFTWADLR
jgi:hypothetical protein